MGLEIIVSVALLLLGIAVLVIIHLCIVGRVFRRADGLNGGGQVILVQREITNGPKGKGMTTEELKRLPCLEYKAGEKGFSSPIECAVCLESFKVGDKCRLLPNCQHCFHAPCVDVWLRETPFCPVCRTCTITPRGDIVMDNAGETSTGFVGDELV
ncbi:hypothetical protein Droror1_Dr00004483 [Drosera rotundifolia]